MQIQNIVKKIFLKDGTVDNFDSISLPDETEQNCNTVEDVTKSI